MLLHRTDSKRKLECFVFLLMAGLLVSVGAIVQAQIGGTDTLGTGGMHSIRGRIVFPSGQRLDVRVKVRLESTGSGDITVMSDGNGHFGFQSLRPGNYTVLIDGGEHYESAREYVSIESANPSTKRSISTAPIPRPFTVQVYLQLKPEAEAKAGVLSAALARVPKTAVDLYFKAQEAAQTGDRRKAIEHLKAALVVYPDFSLALTELGVQYLKTNQPDKAAEALDAAVKLTPEAFPPRLNYGIALLNQRKFAPAEEQFRAALQKTDAPTARMYLGITLAMQRKLAEAEKELIAAAKFNIAEVNLAHRYLGGVYIAWREYERAAVELETYLKQAPKAADAERIRTTIIDLRNNRP